MCVQGLCTLPENSYYTMSWKPQASAECLAKGLLRPCITLQGKEGGHYSASVCLNGEPNGQFRTKAMTSLFVTCNCIAIKAVELFCRAREQEFSLLSHSHECQLWISLKVWINIQTRLKHLTVTEGYSSSTILEGNSYSCLLKGECIFWKTWIVGRRSHFCINECYRLHLHLPQPSLLQSWTLGKS